MPADPMQPGGTAGVVQRPVVFVIACGGTISSQRSTPTATQEPTQEPTHGSGGARPTLTARDLLDMVPELGSIASVESHTYSIKASSDLDIDDILGLHRLLVDTLLRRPDITGFVITQGTDTLEEVAFGLSLLWDDRRPVVMTGAMRNASLPGADGPANLHDAVVAASSRATSSRGVLVVFNGEVHSPRFVRKTHTSNVATFRSPGFGPIGLITERRLRLPVSVERGPMLSAPNTAADHPVALLKFGLGEDGRLIALLAGAGYCGVVIEALGGGHLPGRVATSAELADLVERVPVVLASRTGGGAVLTSTYSGFDGSESDLVKRRLIPSGTLDGPHARVLLTLLLAGGGDRAAVEAAFAAFGG